MNQTGVGPPHFDLRRMHVDVHVLWVDREKEEHDAVSIRIHEPSIGLLDGVRDKAISDESPIDKDVLPLRRGARLCRWRHVNFQLDAPFFAIDGKKGIP